MKALIFLAHGSRREKSNQEVLDMADAIRSPLAAAFDRVDAAFLELVPPSLREAMDGLLEQGVRSITIYPYFLNSGKHVDKDIPDIVDDFRTRYPDCEIVVEQHFGALVEVPRLIVDQLSVANQ